MKSKKSERASSQKDRQDKLLEDRLLISDTHESPDRGLVADENGVKLLYSPIFPLDQEQTQDKHPIERLHSISFFWFFGITWPFWSIKSISLRILTRPLSTTSFRRERKKRSGSLRVRKRSSRAS